MKVPATISSAFIGTSAMTLYSYLLSGAKGKNFKEPETLSILLRRLYPAMSRELADFLCWNAHYAVGLLFVIAYRKLWKEFKLHPGLKTGIGLGAATGLFAIAVWKLVFKLHPRPPKKDFSGYYGQLLIAHIIFGACSHLSYRK